MSCIARSGAKDDGERRAERDAGERADLAPRHVRPDMRGTVPIQHLSRNLPGDHALFEDPKVERAVREMELDPHADILAALPVLAGQ